MLRVMIKEMYMMIDDWSVERYIQVQFYMLF